MVRVMVLEDMGEVTVLKVHPLDSSLTKAFGF